MTVFLSRRRLLVRKGVVTRLLAHVQKSVLFPVTRSESTSAQETTVLGGE